MLSTVAEFHEEYTPCFVKTNLTFHMPFKFPKYKDSSVWFYFVKSHSWISKVHHGIENSWKIWKPIWIPDKLFLASQPAEKIFSPVKKKGAAKLCESPDEALGSYRVLVPPLSPSWREAVTLPAPWHKGILTRQALLVITARNPAEGLIVSIRCGLKNEVQTQGSALEVPL